MCYFFFVLYSRHDLIALVHSQPTDLQPLLIAMIWFFSRGQSSLIEADRYGLLQIDLNQAKSAGFASDPNQLLEPDLNIKLGSQLLSNLGLVQFAGRSLANLLPAVISLANYLSNPQ